MNHNPLLRPPPNRANPKPKPKPIINPPPSSFNYLTSPSITTHSRTIISHRHPNLLDLADAGTLVLVTKDQFGPVPAWRTGPEFVEPDEIWLVGTTHIAEGSIVAVERVVRELRPDNVVVELCRSRAGIMYVSDGGDGELGKQKQMKSSMFSLSGSEFFGAVSRSINLGGQTALALRLLFAFFSSKVSSDVDRPFGVEFRAARRVAEEVGAQIVLGDRPVEITLERAWNSLKWFEKLNLVGAVVRGITSSSDASTAALKESIKEDSPFKLYERLSLTYPSLLQPLVHERDTYLAWSLKRSKAVNGSKRVVGIIGKGHMNGVIYALISDLGDLRFRDLVGERSSNGSSSSWINRLIRGLARDTAIGLLFWVVFEWFKSST